MRGTGGAVFGGGRICTRFDEFLERRFPASQRKVTWVAYAFQKKSTQGIQTPKREIDLIKDPLKRLKEML